MIHDLYIKFRSYNTNYIYKYCAPHTNDRKLRNNFMQSLEHSKDSYNFIIFITQVPQLMITSQSTAKWHNMAQVELKSKRQ